MICLLLSKIKSEISYLQFFFTRVKNNIFHLEAEKKINADWALEFGPGILFD